MNMKRIWKILLGAVAGVAVDNVTGISAFLIGIIPPPWNMLAGPAIGAILNGAAKWLRDNTKRYEFKPAPVKVAAKALAKTL